MKARHGFGLPLRYLDLLSVHLSVHGLTGNCRIIYTKVLVYDAN